jgi:hypothetical protein
MPILKTDYTMCFECFSLSSFSRPVYDEKVIEAYFLDLDIHISRRYNFNYKTSL